MRVAVVVYPGSNADWDAVYAARDVAGFETWRVFHKETSLGDADAVIVPGGFSYGDYLRCGAIARFSPISRAIAEFAAHGRPVLGICNGFQILTELGLLPGALTRNAHLRFECRDVHVRVDAEGAFTHGLAHRVLRMPIAHAEGRFQCDRTTLADLVETKRIALRYSDASGSVSAATNPNGTLDHIAGVYSRERNVLGLMPHPERAARADLGSADGLALFASLRTHLEARGAAQ